MQTGEAMGMIERGQYGAAEAECLGAVNYLAGCVAWMREQKMQHMNPEEDDIARAIFDYLNGPAGDGEMGQPPFTFNSDPDRLYIGVDGYLGCRELAKFIMSRLYAS